MPQLTFFTLLALFLGVAVAGGTLASAQERRDTPTVEVTQLDHLLPSEPCIFSDQHFRNMPAYVFEGGTVSDTAKLRDGSFENDENPGHVSADFEWVKRPKGLTQTGIALYMWEWVGGSSSQSDILQVFGCNRGHLVVLQQISDDGHSEHAGVNFDPKSGILTVKSVRYGSGAHCCPEKLDIVNFRWSGNGFQRIKWKTVPMPKAR